MASPFKIYIYIWKKNYNHYYHNIYVPKIWALWATGNTESK